MYFRFKKLCLLLRRFRSRFGRLQGDPKRTLGVAFIIKIRSKTGSYFWPIFIAFLKVLGRGHAIAPTWPPPSPAAWVLATFRPKSVKIQCVFWYFAKRRFWHPVYFLFLWFSLSLLRRGDAAGSTTLTRNRPRHFTLGITQQLYETSVVHFVQTWKGVLPYANSHSLSGLAFTIAEYGWSCCWFLTLLTEVIFFLSKTTPFFLICVSIECP